jgi:hypothetical protein
MNYDRKSILSLKLRSATHLRKLSRNELFSRLQIIRFVDPITDVAFKQVEEEIWRNQEDDSPHGNPWHVSFHASSFPGDDPMACSRAALYTMADFPSAEPFNRHGRTVMDAGKGIEVTLVRTWHKAGILLSAAPDDPVQTGFEHKEAWLTGSVDSVILPPRWNKPLPVEIKTKYQRDIDDMKLGRRGPDIRHVFQLKTQLALVALAQDSGQIWNNLDRVTHGFIYYLSRDRPSDTAEFRVDLDETFFAAGVERLKQWRQAFIDGVLPEDNPGKRESKFGHPMGWRWSYPPCNWCNHKKTCQLDFRENNQSLSKSAGVNRAKLVRPDYDFEKARQRVLDRWAGNGKITSDIHKEGSR